MPEAYKEYLENCKKQDLTPNKPIVFNKVISSINEAIRDEIIQTGFEWILPFDLGSILLTRKKRKITLLADGRLNQPVDIVKTKLAREKDPNAKPIYFLNLHTKGYYVSVTWYKAKKGIKNQTAYAFNSCKAFRTRINKFLMSSPNTIDLYQDSLTKYLNG